MQEYNQNALDILNDSKLQVAKRTLKDSVFINAFKDKGIALELYKDLHREDQEVRVEDIDIVTLKNVLVGGPVNDLGMVVKNTIMCLVEAQTSVMNTIMLRSLIYLGRTMEQYLNSKDLTIYSARKDNVPNWEIYIIYSEKAGLKGGAQIWRFDSIHSDLYYLDDRETLPIPDSGVVEEYVEICRCIDKIIIREGYDKNAVKELIEYCKLRKGVLSDYIITKEVEIMGVYEEMWTLEGSILAREKEIRRISLEEGMAKGKAEGKAEGDAERQRTVAITMLLDREPIDKIVKYSGLSIEEIEAIKKNL